MDKYERRFKELKKKGNQLSQREILELDLIERSRLLRTYSTYDLVIELRDRKDSLEWAREDLAEFCGFDMRPLNEKILDFLDKYRLALLCIVATALIPTIACTVVLLIQETIKALR